MAMEQRGAKGEGFATISTDGRVLDSWFLQLRLSAQADGAATARLTEREIKVSLGEPAAGYARHDDIRNVDIVPIRTEIGSLASAPVDVHDAYLRLHLLSHRLVEPNRLNLEGIFSLLPNVAWTTLGPCECSRVPEARMAARKRGLTFEVTGVDKFPRMTDYVTLADVRIADADRVRLGAYLAPGTTVMHEGFCNFNAGTLGHCMVEGRISAGVVVGSGSDVGGGASIMGTLSGGGKERITVGERCLIGANAGIGISLGDDCVVEAGCYVTAGARYVVIDRLPLRAVWLKVLTVFRNRARLFVTFGWVLFLVSIPICLAVNATGPEPERSRYRSCSHNALVGDYWLSYHAPLTEGETIDGKLSALVESWRRKAGDG